MPDIPCKEPGCTNLITDPCVKLKGLLIIRKDLSERFKITEEAEQQELLNSLDQFFEKELGLSTSNNNAFLQPERMVEAIGPILFTLICIKGHKHQYSITCQS